MLTPEKIKPLTRNKSICAEVILNETLVQGIIKAYYNKMVEGLVVYTIQTVTLLLLAAICLIVLFIVILCRCSSMLWIVVLGMLVLTHALLTFATVRGTANNRMQRILNTLKEHNNADLKCYAIVIKRHYCTDTDKCIIETVDGDKTIKIVVEDFIFDACVSGSKLLIFCFANKVLLACPLKFFEDFMQGKEPLTWKIHFKDVKEYYSIAFKQWFSQVKEVFEKELEHYRKLLQDLKKQK